MGEEAENEKGKKSDPNYKENHLRKNGQPLKKGGKAGK